MKIRTLNNQTRCFWLIFLSFLWTSCGYLSWLYRLIALLPGAQPELVSEVTGYLLQALGLLLFSLAVRRRQAAAGGVCFALLTGLGLVLTAAAILARTVAGVVAFGLGMNLLYGGIAGQYLYRLTVGVEWRRRSLLFGLGYGLGSVGAWLLSLLQHGSFLRSAWILPVYAAAAAAAALLALRERQPELGRLQFTGETPAPGLPLLAGAAVVLLSVVKGLGFAFPSSELRQGIDLELSRVFYAVGLVIAGVVSDRERRYGAICCVASLGIPFLMLALTDELGPSIVFWILNYLLFGFFTVFRVILFSDAARRRRELLFLCGFGLLLGRVGDAAGTSVCIGLSGKPTLLISLAAVLFAVTIPLFFLLYRRIYLPAPVKERSEQERFDAFCDTYGLSAREQEVLRLVLEGRSTSEIAGELYVSERTVKFHVHNLLGKSDCENRVALVALYRKS